MAMSDHQKLLAKARALAKLNVARLMFPTAIYWADKAHSLSGGHYISDLATYVQKKIVKPDQETEGSSYGFSWTLKKRTGSIYHA